MYKIKNIGKHPMHVNEKDTLYPDEEMEVKELPKNLTWIKVISSPQEKPKAKAKGKRK